MPNFCTYCDMEYPDTTTFCKDCGRQLKYFDDTKENRVLFGKIQVKNVEYENNSGWGPTILIIFGLLFTIVLIGIPCIIVCVWWSYKRADNRKIIATEIDSLVSQLD